MAQRVQSMSECFSEIEDPRSEQARLHDLTDILCLAVLAVIAGAEGWKTSKSLVSRSSRG